MSQLIQKKKLLSFEEICPQWSELRRRATSGIVLDKLMKDNGLDITSHQFCVVGEAHGFDNDYMFLESDKWCESCNDFAMEFCMVIRDKDHIWEETKQTFVNHWNEKHNK